MANLKVVNPNGTTETMEGPDTARTFNEYDSKAMDLELQMNTMQDELAKKKYRVKTTTEVFEWMLNTFFTTVKWEGYECYAITETYNAFRKANEKLKPSKTGKVSFTVLPEILEATFHFIKKYTGEGITTARNHRTVCEDFSVTMAELNTDRQKLMELATEAEAAKHGITVEDYKKAAQQIHADNNQPTPDLK